MSRRNDPAITPRSSRCIDHPCFAGQARVPVEIVSKTIVGLHKLRCYNWIMHNESLLCISDDQLLVDLKAAASHERAATAHLIALLAEMDRRRLYLAQGYSSLFVYCTQCLRLSEHASYGRIEAARASSRFPTRLGLLADGSVTLTTVCPAGQSSDCGQLQ